MSAEEPRPESRLAQSAERLRREIDRWLDVATTQGEKALDAMGLRGEKCWCPRTDVFETAESILVDIDLPGVDAASVSVSLAGNMLTVTGSTPPAPAQEGKTVHLSERRHGEFSRSLPLPAAVDAERVEAEIECGVLHLSIAKSESPKPRQIVVHTTAQGS